MLFLMLKKVLNIFISILLLLPLFTGDIAFSQMVSNGLPSFQKPCDMDHCYPYAPKCPLCPSSTSINLVFYQKAAPYLPAFNPFYIQITSETLTDQGFVKTIFHPPAATS
jgi:hypothetical protein